MKNPFANPLVIKELREEMRSKKIFVLVPAYIAILSIVALVAVGSSGGASFNPLTLSSEARITLYSFIITITILLGLVSIVLGAASFTVEREKATFELLELTPLSYFELVLGKFLYAIVIVGLILTASLPVLSTLFFMGGITYMDVVLTLIYLMVFFAVIVVGAISISVVSKRTILSIILSLAIGFVVSLVISILSAATVQSPQGLGFCIISPWLVTWQQIFSPAPLKLLGFDLPVWPFYLGFYLLLGLLFVVWGRNALDSRKQERSIWARLIGLFLINGYVAVGILCVKSYTTLTIKQVEDFFSVLMTILLVTLPFFTLGTLTDRDRIAFQKHPLWESFHPRKLLLNYPPTGVFYLVVMLFTLSTVIGLCSGLPPGITTWLMLKISCAMFGTIMLWVAPWILTFTGLRLLFSKPQALFIFYGIGTLFYSIFAIFRSSGKSVNSVFEFFLVMPDIFFLVGASIIFYAIARVAAAKRIANVSVQPASSQ